jgi:hypothetical protein
MFLRPSRTYGKKHSHRDKQSKHAERRHAQKSQHRMDRSHFHDTS